MIGGIVIGEACVNLDLEIFTFESDWQEDACLCVRAVTTRQRMKAESCPTALICWKRTRLSASCAECGPIYTIYRVALHTECVD